MTRRSTRFLATATVVGVLALSACGDDGNGDADAPEPDTSAAGGAGLGLGIGLQPRGAEPDPGPGPDPSGTGLPIDPTREGPVVIDGATEGGVVTLLSYTPLETMDPSEAYYTHTSAILSGLVTRSLTQFVYDPATESAVLVPDLATDTGTPNADYTEWTFTLRDGINYEDGTPVTAEDVKFGLERTLDLATFPESPGYYGLEYYEGGADYQGPYTDPGSTLDSIQVDGNTITVSMAKPFPDMPYWMSFPANGPIPQGSASDPETYASRGPLATGPYKFLDYVPGSRLILVRNEQWDPATDPGRTAYPDSYEMDFTGNVDQIDALLLADAGDAQNTMTIDDISASYYRQFTEQAPERIKTGAAPCTRYWAFDYRKITDLKVRQAIAYAYPTEAAIQANGQILGVNRIPATTLLPPGTPGREEYDVLPDYVPGQPDPEKAQALLREAGAQNFVVKFLYASDDPVAVATKDVIARGLQEAGFRTKAVPVTLANLVSRRQDPDVDINVRSAGWCADWPSGGSWYPVLLRSEDVQAIGQIGQNYALFDEPDVDQRIDEVQALPIEDQPAAWNELGRYIDETYLPLFPISYDGTAWAAGSNVNGNDSDGVYGMPAFKNIWLADQ